MDVSYAWSYSNLLQALKIKHLLALGSQQKGPWFLRPRYSTLEAKFRFRSILVFHYTDRRHRSSSRQICVLRPKKTEIKIDSAVTFRVPINKNAPGVNYMWFSPEVTLCGWFKQCLLTFMQIWRNTSIMNIKPAKRACVCVCVCVCTCKECVNAFGLCR